MKYIFAGSQRIARKTATATHYFHQDHLGSATVITDATGAPVEATEYLPFGGQRSHSGTLQAPYKFTDQELDASTGLYNYNARLYDPMTGRFASADTIVPDFANPQSLNRYSYCVNSPLMYIDPSGHSWLSDFTGIHIGFGGDGFHASIDSKQFASFTITAASFFIAGEIIAAPITAAVASGEYATAAAAIEAGVGYSSIAQAGIHCGAGVISGGANSVINGGNIGTGAFIGGLSAGIANYTGPFFPNSFAGQAVGRITIGGATGGLSSLLRGENFEDGLYFGAKSAAFGFIFGSSDYCVPGSVKAHDFQLEKFLVSEPISLPFHRFDFVIGPLQRAC